MLSAVSTKEATNEKVKSIFCFTVAPDMRRKGISTQLLEQICKDAAIDGFDCIEVYPNREFEDAFSDHMGPIEFYKKHGFVVHGEAGKKVVMRKQV